MVHMRTTQLSLRSTAVTNLHIWSIANPHVTVPFERRARGRVVVESWVDTDSLDASNSVHDVCARGFNFTGAGGVGPGAMAFDVGTLKLPSPSDERTLRLSPVPCLNARGSPD